MGGWMGSDKAADGGQTARLEAGREQTKEKPRPVRLTHTHIHAEHPNKVSPRFICSLYELYERKRAPLGVLMCSKQALLFSFFGSCVLNRAGRAPPHRAPGFES